jgi:hypothetical protein
MTYNPIQPTNYSTINQGYNTQYVGGYNLTTSMPGTSTQFAANWIKQSSNSYGLNIVPSYIWAGSGSPGVISNGWLYDSSAVTFDVPNIGRLYLNENTFINGSLGINKALTSSTTNATLDVSGNTNITGYVTSGGPYWNSGYTTNPSPIQGGGFIASITPSSPADFKSGIIQNGNNLQIPTGAYGIYSVYFSTNVDGASTGGGFLILNILQGGTVIKTTESYTGGFASLNTVRVQGLVQYTSSNSNELSFEISTNAGSTGSSIVLDLGSSISSIAIFKVA